MQLKELDDYLQEQEFDGYDLFEENGHENRLFLERLAVHIPEYNIKIREGVSEAWNIESEEYEADYTFYMIFDMLTDEQLLYEEAGSSMEVSLYNFLSSINQLKLTWDELLELSCEVHFI